MSAPLLAVAFGLVAFTAVCFTLAAWSIATEAEHRALRAEAVVAQYVMEAAEERARDEQIWTNVRKALAVRPSRIAIELPDAVCDSEAAQALLSLTIGDRGTDV